MKIEAHSEKPFTLSGPFSFRYGDLIFIWTDWVLCKFATKEGQMHWVIASNFRYAFADEKRTNLLCRIASPDRTSTEEVAVDQLRHFEPVQVIERKREFIAD